MNKKIIFGLLLLTVALMGMPKVLALTQYAAALQTVYGIPNDGQHCTTCHPNSGPGQFTAYGKLFRAVPTHDSNPTGALCSIGAPTGATTNTCSTPRAVLTTIMVSPTTASLTVGGSQTFTATGYDQNGNVIAISPSVVWSSSNTTVGTIDSSAVFSALAAGMTTITATNGTGGTVSGTATVTVTAPAYVAVLTTINVMPATTSLPVGGSQTFTATGFDQKGNATAISPPVVWSSSNTTVGTISSSGVFSALAAGTSTITAMNGTGGTVSGTATVTVTAAVPPPTTGTATVTFVVTDNVTGLPVKGAIVSLTGLDIKRHIGKKAIRLRKLRAKTNDTGIAVFSNVPPGNYKYRVGKDNYRTVSGNVNVTADTQVQVKLVAQSEEGDD